MTGDGSVSDKTCVPESTVVGYMGGVSPYPTYQNYTMGDNYSETLRLEFDGQRTTFSDLLEAYWRYVPDTTMGCPDPAYCPRIFYIDNEQKQLAEASAAKKNISGSLLVILPASDFIFWKAEEYHQNYMKKLGMGCGSAQKRQRRAHEASHIV